MNDGETTMRSHLKEVRKIARNEKGVRIEVRMWVRKGLRMVERSRRRGREEEGMIK